MDEPDDLIFKFDVTEPIDDYGIPLVYCLLYSAADSKNRVPSQAGVSFVEMHIARIKGSFKHAGNFGFWLASKQRTVQRLPDQEPLMSASRLHFLFCKTLRSKQVNVEESNLGQEVETPVRSQLSAQLSFGFTLCCTPQQS